MVAFQKQDAFFCLDSPRCKVPSVHFLHPQSAATPDHRLVPCVVEFTDIPIATNSVRRDSHHGLFSSHIISVRLQIPEIQDFGVLLRRSIFYLPHLQTWTPSSLLGFPQKLFPVAWHPPSTPRRRTSKAIAAQRPIALIRKSEVQRFFPLQVKEHRFFQVFPGPKSG